MKLITKLLSAVVKLILGIVKAVLKIFKRFLILVLIVALLGVGALFYFLNPSPAKTVNKAASALEDNGYSVQVLDEDEIAERMANGVPVGVKKMLYASKGDEGIVIIEFKTAKAARLYYQQLKLERDYKIDTFKLQIKQLKLDIKNADSDEEAYLTERLENLQEALNDYRYTDHRIGRSGSTVWYGTLEAIHDAKK